jgi:signal transduction histidine kinase/ActR/RegA family two-component response regulator
MQRILQSVLRGWYDLPLRFKGMIVITVPLLCILYSVVALYIFQSQRTDLTQWISRAFQVGSGIQSVATLLSEAENGARGYLLTRDQQYLEPVRKAQAELANRLDRMEEILQGSAAQLERAGRVEVLGRQRLAALEAALTASAGDVPARLARGAEVTAAIQREFTAMRNEESRLWIQRIAAETALRNRLTIVMYTGAGLSLLAGVIAMSLFLTGIVRRSQLLRHNAERLARGEPLADLPPAADEIGQLGVALASSSALLAAREVELRKLNQQLDEAVQERTTQLQEEITHRKRSEEQLRQSQKMEAIGRLAGGVAHDFNNVLTVLFGCTESLKNMLASNSPAQADLQELMRASEHAASLTRQLLAFSRRQLIVPKVVDLNEIVRRSENLLRRVIGEDVELKTACRQSLSRILVDAGQIEQIIMNLAVNARDAMPMGGTLTLRTEEVELDDEYCVGHLNTVPGRYVMLSVADSGQGMTAEVQSHLFEPFFTTKEPGKGTGLGLPTVYGIVKQSQGNIWVYSEPGFGTTFKIYFPVAVAAEVEAPSEALAPAATPKNFATVLLVEDEEPVRRITRQILSRGGYRVMEADGAESARALCANHAGGIDLLLTDVIMPRTNGCQLADELTGLYPGMKVLFMSGYTDDIILHHGVLKNGAAFIEKPFSPKSLAAKVQDLLEPAGANGKSANGANGSVC